MIEVEDHAASKRLLKELGLACECPRLKRGILGSHDVHQDLLGANSDGESVDLALVASIERVPNTEDPGEHTHFPAVSLVE